MHGCLWKIATSLASSIIAVVIQNHRYVEDLWIWLLRLAQLQFSGFHLGSGSHNAFTTWFAQGNIAPTTLLSCIVTRHSLRSSFHLNGPPWLNFPKTDVETGTMGCVCPFRAWNYIKDPLLGTSCTPMWWQVGCIHPLTPGASSVHRTFKFFGTFLLEIVRPCCDQLPGTSREQWEPSLSMCWSLLVHNFILL
jgi:hypothetical protein